MLFYYCIDRVCVCVCRCSMIIWFSSHYILNSSSVLLSLLSLPFYCYFFILKLSDQFFPLNFTLCSLLLPLFFSFFWPSSLNLDGLLCLCASPLTLSLSLSSNHNVMFSNWLNGSLTPLCFQPQIFTAGVIWECVPESASQKCVSVCVRAAVVFWELNWDLNVTALNTHKLQCVGQTGLVIVLSQSLCVCECLCLKKYTSQ